MKWIFGIVFLMLSFPFLAQEKGKTAAAAPEKEKYFPQVVRENLIKYNAESHIAYENGDRKKAEFLFDTLVNLHLVGTQFKDYNFKRVYGGKTILSDFGKPLLIQTYTSWCVLNKGEIPAINKIANRYRKMLQIVIVFWDKRQNVKDLASKFNSNIEVCYVNENVARNEDVVSTLKYGMGFLASYYLDSSLKVLSIKKGTAAPPVTPKKIPMKELVKTSYDVIEKGILDVFKFEDTVKKGKKDEKYKDTVVVKKDSVFKITPLKNRRP